MGPSCRGSQNHGYCPQGAYDPKLSQERTKELRANSHYHRQMCVRACAWTASVEARNVQEALGFQLILVGKASLPLVPRCPPLHVKRKAD